MLSKPVPDLAGAQGVVPPVPFISLAEHSDIRRVEQVIAVARVFVSLGAVETVHLAPVQFAQTTGLASALLVLYSALALIFLLLPLRHQTVPTRLPLSLHIVDVSFAVILTASHGLNGPLLLSLLFPLLAAGYRWGFREVMVTAAVVDVLLGAASILLGSGLWPSVTAAVFRFDLNAFLANAMFVAVAGAAVGYLAENEHRRRKEAVAVSRVVAQARPGADFNETLNRVLSSIRDVFGARMVLLALRDSKTGRVFLWTNAMATAAESPGAKEVLFAARGDYLFASPGVAWHAVAHWFWKRGGFDVIAIDKQGRRLPSVDLALPAGFVNAYRCRRVLCVSLTFSDDWSGRVFIIEPALGIHRDLNARFALRLASQAGRVMYSHYLVHRVRMRAQAVERGRIARELHDGLTQSLLGLEMQLAAVRRRAIAEAPSIDPDLARIHAVLRDEIIRLRELMEGIRAGNNTSGDVVEELADMVERFRRYTGIAAKFVSEQRPAGVSVHMRRQIARILHEALVNIRKHSNAKRVLVRAGVQGDRWRISIEDDGRGFPFAGRLSQTELEAGRHGPRMIGERVRIIGGDMIVDSRPGSGACVEVTIPLPERHD